MTGLRRHCIATLVVCWIPMAAHAQAPSRGFKVVTAEPQAGASAVREVEIRSSVTRTAVWVGDHVTYTVDITCAPNVDILVDDLAKEKLRLRGLDLVATDTTRTPLPTGGVRYGFVYELATYEVDTESLRIEDLTVRYYVRRPGQRIEDAAPAGEAAVRGAAIGLRSTIPDVLPDFGVRDERQPADLPAALALGRPVGIGLLLLSAAPVGIWMASCAWRVRPRRVRSHARQAKRLTRTALEELRALDISMDASRKDAYGRLDALVRRHVASVTGIPTDSLTAGEIARRLRANGSRVPADTVAALLDQCERARYGSPGQLPSVDQFREALASTEELVAAGRPTLGLTSFLR